MQHLQLYNFNIFNGRPLCVHNGWRFDREGTMLVEGPHHGDVRFPKVLVRRRDGAPPYGELPCQVLDGSLKVHGGYGNLRMGKGKQQDGNMALMVIVADGEIILPDLLYHDHRVKIDPVFDTEGYLCATVICFLKTQELPISVQNEYGTREILFRYSHETGFPDPMDVTLPDFLKPKRFAGLRKIGRRLRNINWLKFDGDPVS